ncbi:MAG TPA: hypothetical protein VIN08_10450, partial [Ohtaekwangia sp.]|uniref:hypothetical protein n=1 Tax=Ohtaekwangia sp. TaxID=2066019 RepID=UPI002F95144D
MLQTFLVMAQDNVTVGKPYVVIDADAKYYFAAHGEILTVKTSRKSITLQKLDAVNLTFLKIKLYDDFPKNFEIERITQIKNRYFVFYSLRDGVEQLFYREIDFASCSFKGQGKKLLVVNDRIADRYDKFDFYFSYDSSAMVVQYRLSPEHKNDSKNFDEIGAHVFDQNMQEKWSGVLTMPYTEKKMNNLDYSVDSKGNVYIVTQVYNDETTRERKRGEEEANYHLEVLKASAPTGAITASKIDVADKFIKTIWIYETAKGDLIGAGFYNIGKNKSDADGVVLFKLGTDGKPTDLIAHEIPVEILNQYASAKSKRRNEKKNDDDRAEFEDLRLQDIAMQEDGSTILVGEQRFIVSRTSYSTMNGVTTTRTTTYYYCNDILVTKITPAGKLAWMKKLPKRQTGGAGWGGMSYTYFRGAHEHYFLFLDNEKNKDLPITEVPAQHVDGAGGFLTAYKVNDAAGEVTKLSLLNTRDVKGMEVYQFSPSRIMATAPSTIVFEAYKKKKEDILV